MAFELEKPENDQREYDGKNANWDKQTLQITSVKRDLWGGVKQVVVYALSCTCTTFPSFSTCSSCSSTTFSSRSHT